MDRIGFDKTHSQWVDAHLGKRTGEAKRRLKTGHAHAEKEFLRHVWWPAFGHFEHLHPEYETLDFFDGKRYIDFAYVRAGVRIAIEVDPYGTHYSRLDRRQYSNQWVRHMHMLNDNWVIAHIGFDDVTERPRLWQQLFQQMIGRLFGDQNSLQHELGSRERDILRMALRAGRSIKLSDVQSLFQCGYDTARKQIKLLETKKWLLPEGKGTVRTHSWIIDTSRKLPPL